LHQWSIDYTAMNYTMSESLPLVETNDPTGIETTNATLRGHLINDGNLDCNVSFEWGTTTILGNWTMQESKDSGEYFNFNLTGLSPGTLYHYRAVANNSLGSSNGTIKKFLTKPEKPTSFNANAYDYKQINLTWVKGDGAEYTYIERNATGVTEWERGEGDWIYYGDGTSHSDDAWLNYGTRYYYQAWSYINKSLLSQYSDYAETNEKTDNVLIPTVQTLIYEDIDETSVKIRGYLNDDGGAPCSVWLRYGKDDSCDTNTTKIMDVLSGTYFNKTLSGLDPGTLYYYRAVAENINGSSLGNTFTFITKPYEPSNFNAVAYNSTSINITWDKGIGANGTYVERNEIQTWDRGNGIEIYSGNEQYFNDTNLEENKTYYYQAWSKAIWFSTIVYSTNYVEKNETTLNKPNVTEINPLAGEKGVTTEIGQLTAKIIDKDLEPIEWSIETYPDIGHNSGTNSSGDIITCSVLTLSHGVKYYWYVNLTSDGENPANNSRFVDLSLSLINATIEELDGEYINWTIETYPDIGSYYGNDESSGDKMCTVSGLQYNTTYTWWVNVTDGKVWTKETYYFSTNYYPTIYSPNPIDDEIVFTSPVCSVEIGDVDEEVVTVKFYENTTGLWLLKKVQEVDTKTQSQASFEYTNANQAMTYYWWKVTATDENGGDAEKIYKFRTNNPMNLYDEYPEHNSFNIRHDINQLNVTIENPDGTAFNWTITTSPDIGNASGTLETNGTKVCSISGLTYGTTYLWTVYVEDGEDENTVIFEFKTASKPILSLISPENNSNTKITPKCIVETSDVDGGTGTIYFYENTTGSWILQSSEEVSLSSTEQTEWIYENATTYGKKYWWKAKIMDDRGYYDENIFCFTPINLPPTISNPFPQNNSLGVSIYLNEITFDIEDPEGDGINWTIETYPNIGYDSEDSSTNGTKICVIYGLQKNTTYTWWVNSTAGGEEYTNRTYGFKTIEGSSIYDEKPTNNTETNIRPSCSVKVNSPDGGQGIISFYENTTGSWVLQKTQIINLDYMQTVYWNYYDNASVINETYWWKVVLDDYRGGIVEEIYSFKTDDSPIIFNEQPQHGSYGIPKSLSYLNVTIEDPNGESIDWTIETYPDIGGSSGNSETNGTKSCGISGLVIGETYTWYVNASDSDDTSTTEYTFKVSGAPSIDQIVFETTPIPLQPFILIYVYDEDYDNVTVKIYENTTGSWVLQKTQISNYSVEIIEFDYINATEYETKYWMKINLSDGKGGYFEGIYNFTTRQNLPPSVYGPNPTNNSIDVSPGTNHLRITIEDEESTFNYTIETYPNVGSQYVTDSTNGQKICGLGTLEFNTTYDWWVNVTDGTHWTNKTYTFKTGFNDKILISNPSPENHSHNMALSFSQISINIEEPNGDPIQWSIETYPNIGSNSGGGDVNGTKTCAISGLSPGTFYTWYVNATDGYQYVRKYYHFTTSYNPIIVSVYPENNSQGIGQEPECRITVDDPDEIYDHLTIYWYELFESEWVLRQTSYNLTELPDTRTWNYSGATNPAKTYWWKVVVEDNKGCSVTGIYNFMPTENEPPELYYPNPSNNSINVPITKSLISVEVTDRENDLINWEITTSPDIGSNYGIADPVGIINCPISSLDYGTTYTWYVNVIDETGSGQWTNNTYTFTTSYWPEVTNVFPANNSRAYIEPECSIDVYDGDGGMLTVKFYENTTGSWVLQKESLVVASPKNTITWNYENASDFGNKYYWRINVSDANDHYIDKIYNFDTNRPPIISSPNPSNNSTNTPRSLNLVEVYIEDPEGDFIDWTIETSPYIGYGFGNSETNGTKNCFVLNLQYCTEYTWYVNVTDGVSDVRETYNFKTECKPTIISTIPINNEQNIKIMPIINVTIYDSDGGDVEVKFQENTTGSWVQKYQQIVDGTSPINVTWDKYENADYYGTWYWWRVILIDEQGNIEVGTFKLRTVENNNPVLSNENPTNENTNINLAKSNLYVDVEDAEGHQMEWTIETYPNIGSASGNNQNNGTLSCSISGLQAEETYVWYVNVTDSYGWTREVYEFDTTMKTIIRNPIPENNGISERYPVCSVEVFDPDGDEVAVEFFRKSGIDWISMQLNSSINASTPVRIVWDKYSNADTYSTDYWWKVIVYDEKNSQNESIFKFRTVDNNHPQIVSTSPSNGEMGISVHRNNVSVTISDLDGHPMNITISGTYLYTNSLNFVGNGTYYAQHKQRLPYSGDIYWKVEINDGYNWTNQTFHFYTEYDIIDPQINSVSVVPDRAKRNSLIVIEANVTDNDEVDFAEVVFPSLGKRYPMFEKGNNMYGYEANFTLLGTYLFYIYAEDIWGNSNISGYYNFTIVAKEVKIELHTVEYVNKISNNAMLVSIKNAYTGKQLENRSQNISCYISNKEGFIILNGTHPTEIAPGIYQQLFNLTNNSGSFIAWINLEYNSSIYMQASIFEIKYFAYENITDLSTRLNDLVTVAMWTGTNSTRELIEHLSRTSEATKDVSEDMEKSGIGSKIEETVVGQLFGIAFMAILLIIIFIVASLIYGKQRAIAIAKKVADIPTTAINIISGQTKED